MKTLFVSTLMVSAIMLASCTPSVPQEPETEEPTTGKEQAREVARTGEVAELVTVTSPEANFAIESPVMVSGTAPGYWFFEATAPVDIVNWDGLIIGQGYITAQSDWMTEDMVPFEGMVEYEFDSETSYSDWGWVILSRSNASDLPENDAAVEIPVMLR